MADLQHLLTMAAKAAGIELGEYDHSVRTYESPHYGAPAFLLKGRSGHGMADYWNAATDDSDSRRLQVALGMTCRAGINDAIAYTTRTLPGAPADTVEPVANGDLAAALRMAVLKCAAAIGEAMP